MKIVAGIGSIDDYLPFCEAGADELFFGYIPLEYMKEYGRSKALNRREVIYYNVQIGSESEMMILKDMIIKTGGAKGVVTLNALSFDDAQLDYILRYIEKCKNLGFRDFIVSDRRLIKMMGEVEGVNIHVSGELGVMTSHTIHEIYNKNVKRIIFPRQTSLEDMELVIERTKDLNLSYEAFVLNEKCHFTGAYCNSIHCDELCHMCKVPYKTVAEGNMCVSDSVTDRHVIGETGCGLCSLYRLKKMGVTHLKIVSRGNASKDTKADIAALKRALTLLYEAKDEKEYIEKMKKELFLNGCSKNCYMKLW